MIKKYVKKSIVVEAVQNTGDNVSEIHEFMGDKSRPVYKLNGYVYLIDTLEGTMTANVGDYIIKMLAITLSRVLKASFILANLMCLRQLMMFVSKIVYE